MNDCLCARVNYSYNDPDCPIHGEMALSRVASDFYKKQIKIDERLRKERYTIPLSPEQYDQIMEIVKKQNAPSGEEGE